MVNLWGPRHLFPYSSRWPAVAELDTTVTGHGDASLPYIVKCQLILQGCTAQTWLKLMAAMISVILLEYPIYIKSLNVMKIWLE